MSNAEAVRRYRQRHPERARAWRARNRRKLRLHNRRWQHRQLGYAPGEVECRFTAQAARCATCPKPIALGRGGWRRGPDLALICAACWWDNRLDHSQVSQ